ncbi:MAG: beta-galactosidase [Sedimentisphaerales bacterium]|nr:beta-galactosidase [Sedimentisphaerales bacterium]
MNRIANLSLIAVFSISLLISIAASAAQPVLLFDFGSGFPVASVQTSDAKADLSASGSLRVTTGHEKTWPGITLKAPEGKWNLAPYRYITAEIKNIDSQTVTVNCRVDNPGADGTNNCITDNITLAPGKSATLTVNIFPTPWRLSEPLELIGMRGFPVHKGKLDTANITQLLFFLNKPYTDHAFEIDNIRAAGEIRNLDAKTFIPFIDEFGQFAHNDWPGKIHSEKDLLNAKKTEENDFDQNPGPADWNQYGGWTAGPKLKATGSFRVEKFNDKWWLVDPEGRLFFSHGIDCVGSGNATPITDREHYYAALPKSSSPFAQFYGTGSWAPHGYYNVHSPYKTYDFSRANLLRKYGRTWKDDFAQITHRRLKSWAMNTIANWSAPEIYFMRKTPYVCTISYSSRQLEGSQGYWGKFYDVFDPSFRSKLRGRLASEKDETASDPWCIGYFVHNEIAWGDELSLALAALASPPDQPAKKVFIDDLKTKYKTIASLNKAWKTTYPDWQALLKSVTPPDRNQARQDLAAFYTKTAETYFKTIREELKAITPAKLYLGCRFAWVNDRAARAAAKFCDVVSYNRYARSVEDLALPDRIDMPLIIGEFHFGALDRGMFHTGLVPTADQKDRAEKYRSYLRGALRNPYIVGTHWFQYKDQATTGRGDGENYQIGFIDVADTPNPEIVEAARKIGRSMYQYRLENK